ncbi:MAG: hypothetical protein FWB85_01420 [Chitinispirillia bacterium]|nr:hypothetical protein [Chitinispirillia bacterium]MCL2241351.1 hypothetical protein [Chitinispirillia bacterium]
MAHSVTDAQRAIEARVEDGSVLNREGQWVHMFEQLTIEQRVIEELSAGKVNVNGAWIRIVDAKKWAGAPRNPGAVAAANHSPSVPIPLAAAPVPAPAPIAQIPISQTPLTPGMATSVFEAEDNMLETIAMDASVIKQIAVMGGAPAGINTAPAVPLVRGANSNFGLYNYNAGETDTFDAGLAASGAAPHASGEDFRIHDDMCETTMMTFDNHPPAGKQG